MILKRIVLSILLVGFAGASAAQVRPDDAVIHLVRRGTVVQQPVTSDSLWRRIEDMSSRYRDYAPVPRAALFDVTYPANPEEYRALAGYGLLMVTVVTQDPTEIPVARVYLRGDRIDHTFELVSSVQSPVRDEAVATVLGAHRYDALYFFPMYLRSQPSELLVDYAAHRREFVLGKLPLDPKDDGLPTDPPSASRPPQEALTRIVERELPGFLVTATRE